MFLINSKKALFFPKVYCTLKILTLSPGNGSSSSPIHFCRRFFIHSSHPGGVYRCFQKKWVYPQKSSIFIGFSIINHQILGYPYVWKHLYGYTDIPLLGGTWHLTNVLLQDVHASKETTKMWKNYGSYECTVDKWHVKQTQGCSDTHPHTYYLKKILHQFM